MVHKYQSENGCLHPFHVHTIPSALLSPDRQQNVQIDDALAAINEAQLCKRGTSKHIGIAISACSTIWCTRRLGALGIRRDAEVDAVAPRAVQTSK